MTYINIQQFKIFSGVTSIGSFISHVQEGEFVSHSRSFREWEKYIISNNWWDYTHLIEGSILLRWRQINGKRGS